MVWRCHGKDFIRLAFLLQNFGLWANYSFIYFQMLFFFQQNSTSFSHNCIWGWGSFFLPTCFISFIMCFRCEIVLYHFNKFRAKDVKTSDTFNLAAEELHSKAHAGRSGPLWVNSDETGQQGFHYPHLRRVIVAVSFKYLETDEKGKWISKN